MKKQAQQNSLDINDDIVLTEKVMDLEEEVRLFAKDFDQEDLEIFAGELNRFEHLGHSDWDSRIFLTREEYHQSSVEDKRIIDEAYAIWKELRKLNSRKSITKMYVDDGRKITVLIPRNRMYLFVSQTNRSDLYDMTCYRTAPKHINNGRGKVIGRNHSLKTQDVFDFCQNIVGRRFYFEENRSRNEFLLESKQGER